MKEYYLNQLRDRTISIVHFREASASLSKLIALEVSLEAHGSQKIILVPILRAGLSLLASFQDSFIEAPIGFIGIKRDEKTALPRLYYENLPPISPEDHVLVLDPMLATGGSANLALDLLKTKGAKSVTLVTILAAPEGIQWIKERHPKVHIYTVAIDKGLDAQKYIVPGLGDFGDRYFGTI